MLAEFPRDARPGHRLPRAAPLRPAPAAAPPLAGRPRSSGTAPTAPTSPALAALYAADLARSATAVRAGRRRLVDAADPRRDARPRRPGRARSRPRSGSLACRGSREGRDQVRLATGRLAAPPSDPRPTSGTGEEVRRDPVVHRLLAHRPPGARGVDDLAVADVERDVVDRGGVARRAPEHQVARPQVAGRDRRRLLVLRDRVVRQRDARRRPRRPWSGPSSPTRRARRRPTGRARRAGRGRRRSRPAAPERARGRRGRRPGCRRGRGAAGRRGRGGARRARGAGLGWSGAGPLPCADRLRRGRRSDCRCAAWAAAACGLGVGGRLAAGCGGLGCRALPSSAACRCSASAHADALELGELARSGRPC